MSKCHVRELRNVYTCLFRDACKAFPTLETDFERDLTRLQRLVEQRGLGVYLRDLPAVGKHFDRCLANGQYNLSGLPLTKRFSARVVIPKFLRGLYLLIFDESGLLKEDCCTEAILFVRQICFAAKKAEYPCSRESVDDAVADFFAVDLELPELDSFWTIEVGSPYYDLVEEPGFRFSALLQERLPEDDSRKRFELQLFLTNLDTVSRLVATTLGSYDPLEWRFRHGPGAISQITGPTNKYSWSSWSDILERVYPIADCGYHNFCSWADKCKNAEVSSNEPTSRLIAVPKTYSGPRLIAAEPGEHQWCQQNCWDYLCNRVSGTWIGRLVSFRDQSRNQALCTLGSETGTLATVDLSAASDRVTCHVVAQMFRSNPTLLRALRASRTRRITQAISEKSEESLELRKFSTMGSAVTFPVETLIFLSVALAAVATVRRLRIHRSEDLTALQGEVSVFGDDIVIPTDSRELFVDALELLWFKVNSDKSYWTGRFRESCGVDSYNGCNVTPVYWKRFYDGKPESLASVVESSNNFYKKFLLTTAFYLASTLRGREILPVTQGSGVFGFETRLVPDHSCYRQRWNGDLQRAEVRGVVIQSSQRRSPTNDDSALLQYFTEAPSPWDPWQHGVAQRPSVKARRGWVPVQSAVLSG